MALYRVVGNYYTDLLDYLAFQQTKVGGNIEKYLSTIGMDGKKQLIDKLGLLFQRVEILKKAEQRFWENKKRTSLIFIIILSILMFIALAVIGALLIMNMKVGATLGMNKKIRMMLMYFIGYLVTFTILLLVVVNINEGRKRAERMMVETAEDIERLKKLIDVTSQLRLLLLFTAYKTSENRTVYQMLLKTNNAFLSPFIINLSQGGETNSNPMNFDINYDLIFQKYRSELLNTLNNFYANGNGYKILQKELISSSNIMIVMEFKKLLQFYYTIGVRKMNIQNAGENNVHIALDKVLIPELGNLSSLYAMANANAYTDASNPIGTKPPSEFVSSNLGNAAFKKEHDRIIMLYVYILTYGYQIHSKKLKSNSEFNTAIIPFLPTDIDISASIDTEFAQFVKDSFLEHYGKTMPTLVNDAVSSTQLSSVYLRLVQGLRHILLKYYLAASSKITGDYYFIYDAAYISENVKSKATSLNVPLETEYIDEVMTVITSNTLSDLYDSFKLQNNTDSKVSAFVNKLAQLMYTYNIKVFDNSTYILEKLNQAKPLTDDLRNTITSILAQVDKAIVLKKQSLGGGTSTSMMKFLDFPEFIVKLDEMTYNDLRMGLSTEFFKDVMDKFYYAVSNAIFTQSKTSKDIYFSHEKKFKLARISIIMVLVILIFVLLYFSLMSADELKITRDASMENSRMNNKDAGVRMTAYSQWGEQYANTIIKMILPWVFGIFTMSVLYSFYRKGLAKFRFNKETIDTNSNILRTSLQDLNNIMTELDTSINLNDRGKKISQLTVINTDLKSRLHKLVINVIDKAEKCNYVLSTSKTELPFPYAEVIVDAFMVCILVACLFVVLGKINPIQRIMDLKTLYTLKAKGQYQDSDASYAEEVKSKAKCHDSDMDTVIFTVKILFFMFVIMFMVFYASKVITSTSDFEYGLYNSSYFEESRCYGE